MVQDIRSNPNRFGFTVFLKRGDAFATSEGTLEAINCKTILAVSAGKTAAHTAALTTILATAVT